MQGVTNVRVFGSQNINGGSDSIMQQEAYEKLVKRFKTGEITFQKFSEEAKKIPLD